MRPLTSRTAKEAAESHSRAARKRALATDYYATAWALSRVLWLHVADRAHCGCESRQKHGAAWTAPLCAATRVLGLGRHFDCDTTAKKLLAMGYSGSVKS